MLLKDLQTLATKLATGTLFHVEKAGKAYSVDYSALAKAIIEEYADSTVGGSAQTVQAAIGALNSRLNGYVTIENFTITIGQCKPGVDYRQSVPVSKEGYRPFGIIGYDVLGTYGSWFQVTKVGIVDWNTATVVLRAPAGEFTTDNTAVKITVLYQKNITS